MSVKKNSELMNAPKIWYEIIKGYNENLSVSSEEVTTEFCTILVTSSENISAKTDNSNFLFIVTFDISYQI
ncbi:hypothetical protein J7889_04025 [Mycoplasmopsis agalactiae]|nr:hypothetical protein [Mycoplasmopsis agalactiae]MCE6056729.1 hypothetical protein [Mycoplasmopsis agalactiae]